MEKLEYDSLHKFLVSLGIVLIALPFVSLLYLLNTDVALISQIEYDQLSQYSQYGLQQREQIMNIILKVLPFLLVIMFITGVILVIVGIRNWKKVQKDLDALIEAERIQKELDSSTLKNSEVLAKTESEIKDDFVLEESHIQSQHDRILKYMEIEERYFANALPIAFRRRHIFKRNVRIGKYDYDAIAISTESKCDIIFEIKYWRQPMPFSVISNTLHRLYEAGTNYQTVQQRDFSCVLAIIAPKETIERIRKSVEKHIHETSNYNHSQIDIQYIAEEDI